MEPDEQIKRNDAEEKITMLKKEIDYKTQCIEKLYEEISTLTENKYNTNYKELIKEKTKVREAMCFALDEIRGTIPDFNEKTFKQYEKYFAVNFEIESITADIQRLTKIGDYMHEKTTQLEEKVSTINMEIAHLKCELAHLESALEYMKSKKDR